jgi:hypothetical protein
MTLDYQYQRANSDLLEAERRMRQKSESIVQEYSGILHNIALRLDGERYEKLRKVDPGIPGIWSATDWNNFFDSAPLGWKREPSSNDMREQIETLQAKLQKAERRALELSAQQQKENEQRVNSKPALPNNDKFSSPRSASPEVSQKSSMPDLSHTAHPGATPAREKLLDDIAAVKKKFPQTAPEGFTALGGERQSGELEKAFHRFWIALYLIGFWQLAATMEIEEITGSATGAGTGTGSMKRIVDDLEKHKIILSKLYETKLEAVPQTSLRLTHLTEKGETLYRLIYGLKPQENEWDYLLRARHGQENPIYTQAVITVAMHARKRGYTAKVVDIKPLLDVCLIRGDEIANVAILTGEGSTDWSRLASLNSGKAAICAITTQSRASLVAEAKKAGMSGMATDIETLVQCKFGKINEQTPFWLETW